MYRKGTTGKESFTSAVLLPYEKDRQTSKKCPHVIIQLFPTHPSSLPPFPPFPPSLSPFPCPGDDRSYDTVTDSDGNWEILLAPENRQEPFQV